MECVMEILWCLIANILQDYIKKLIEDRAVGEEGVELLQYCNWENPHFARVPLVWNSSLCRKAGFSIMRHSQHTLTGLY
ncbi:PREDICTED: probable ubiquitin carboxyl-terminal hydrolase FAF [Rhagoletis zephyria]|uniref:probable ubiquitin carboxyl-terminal hydrolase FAF n=1 Tax=Rhagoletis zephyria TaxID=28612 RepID=UPI0008114D0A|nr:PREDICTED: probable ubiquitin carboxyl-terminal hydrolase FAF [Rhagoletis zephyria]